MKENIFVAIAYKILEQKKYQKVRLIDCFKTNCKRRIKMPIEVQMLDSKIMRGKNHHL